MYALLILLIWGYWALCNDCFCLNRIRFVFLQQFPIALSFILSTVKDTQCFCCTEGVWVISLNSCHYLTGYREVWILGYNQRLLWPRNVELPGSAATTAPIPVVSPLLCLRGGRWEEQLCEHTQRTALPGHALYLWCLSSFTHQCFLYTLYTVLLYYFYFDDAPMLSLFVFI